MITLHIAVALNTRDGVESSHLSYCGLVRQASCKLVLKSLLHLYVYQNNNNNNISEIMHRRVKDHEWMHDWFRQISAHSFVSWRECTEYVEYIAKKL